MHYEPIRLAKKKPNLNAIGVIGAYITMC